MSNKAKKLEAEKRKTYQLAFDQAALLRESNALATKALNEAQSVRADSEKASKNAKLSTIIAVASLIVALISLVWNF